VVFITLVHLMDSRYGASAIKPGFVTTLLNLRAKFRGKKKRGLTEEGRQAIKWLANVGIMTDITHMSDLTRKQTLDFMLENNIAPLVTHDMFKPIQNHPRGMDEEDILKVYLGGGLMSIPNSGVSLEPYKPRDDYRKKLADLKEYCPESIDSYKFTYTALQKFIESNTGVILNDSTIQFSDLSEDQKVSLAIGFQSDFNGWLNHHRPRYGEDGCYTVDPDTTYEAIDLQGLAHPGLMESHWRLLQNEGVDVNPVKRASEKFLQMWDGFLAGSGRF